MNDMKLSALEVIEDKAQLFKEISDKIWDAPELSLKEFKAAEIYIEALRNEGFEVKEKLCGIDTAFSGSFGKGRPVIGILGEFDALSGLSQKAGMTEQEAIEDGGNGHGCGHNLLGAGAFAAAVAVKNYLEKTGKEGTVIFFGCPGEEGGSGKAFMARENAWRCLDAALTWHPASENQVVTGTCNSCIQVLYKFSGVAAHAAGNPHDGRSALDAVELMNIGVQFLREHMTDDCRIHYAVTDSGGVSPNVVQAKASVLYMVRSTKVADSVKLQARVDDIAKGAALMTGTTYERIFIDGTANTLPNHKLEKLLYENFKEIGVPQYDASEIAFADAVHSTYPHGDIVPGIGAMADPKIANKVRKLTKNMTKPLNDFLMPLYTGELFMPGSTDVGDVSWQTPTAQINVVTLPADAPGHSWQTVTCGKTSIAHKGMLCAGKVLAAAAIDLFDNAEALAAAKKEFLDSSRSGYVCPIEDGAVPIAL